MYLSRRWLSESLSERWSRQSKCSLRKENIPHRTTRERIKTNKQPHIQHKQTLGVKCECKKTPDTRQHTATQPRFSILGLDQRQQQLTCVLQLAFTSKHNFELKCKTGEIKRHTPIRGPTGSRMRHIRENYSSERVGYAT